MANICHESKVTNHQSGTIDEVYVLIICCECVVFLLAIYAYLRAVAISVAVFLESQFIYALARSGIGCRLALNYCMQYPSHCHSLACDEW